jgi:D-arabinose 1-dehydrogenase-like Zn-dependent alcohol dehydrogenase
MQGTMKAARIYGFEKATSTICSESMKCRFDIESGEVLIRVLRAGLNHGDLHMREDAVQYTSEVPTIPFLPMVIGHDGLGEVVEVGPDVSNVRVGDRVVVMCSITCGYCKFCRSDRQHLCLAHRVMGFIAKWGEAGSKRILRYKEGLWAEYCRVPATNVVKLRPDDDIDEMCKVSQMTWLSRAKTGAVTQR